MMTMALPFGSARALLIQRETNDDSWNEKGRLRIALLITRTLVDARHNEIAAQVPKPDSIPRYPTRPPS